MKNQTVFYFLCATALLLGACTEQERQVTPDLINFPQTASSDSSAQPLAEIAFDTIDFDFGIISIGEKVMHSYGFTNKGKAPLIISQVTPSCGCTTLKDWPRDPIMPGEGGKITVEFNSTGFPGPILKTITVATNGIPKDWYLKLSGNVVGKEVFEEGKSGVEMKRER